MKNNKGKVALNDELLERVSGGEDDIMPSCVCPLCGCETADGVCQNERCEYSPRFQRDSNLGPF